MDSPQSPDDDRCRAPERDAFPMAIPATSSAQTGNCPPEWSWAKWGQRSGVFTSDLESSKRGQRRRGLS
jgi:hypothetical protein